MKPSEKPAPDPLEILDTRGVARWLKKSPRTVQRLGLPHIPDQPGRYLVADILAFWQQKKKAAA